MVVTVRPIVVWRVLLLGFAVVYVLSARLQSWLPPLLPFLAAAAVEAQFFLAGLRASGQRRPAPDRGPQERDLEQFGWATRTVTARLGDSELVLRPGEMEPEEIAQWLDLHREALVALGPGRHELAPIETPESPPAPYRPPPPRRAPRRAQTRLVQALAVLALLAGLFWLDTSAPHWQGLSAATRRSTLAVLDREATRIAGHPAQVICDVSGRHVGYVQDADGLAVVGGRTLWLTPEICYRLYRIRHTGRTAGSSSGEAIAVLAHEAWHLHGQAGEGLANCFAYQSGVQVGESLGLSPATARQLMREQLASNPADFAGSPEYIVPPGCHRGGSFDLHLDGSHFP
jgi:hypothetical protein